MVSLVSLVACQGSEVKKDPVGPVGKVDRPSGPVIDPRLGPLVKLGPARMQIPVGWMSTPEKSLSWHSGLQGSEQRRATFNVVVGDPKQPGELAEDVYRALSEVYHSETEGVQSFLEEGVVPLGGWGSALRMLSEREQDGVVYRLLQFIAVGDRHIYYLTWTTRAPDYEALQSDFHRASATFSE